MNFNSGDLNFFANSRRQQTEFDPVQYLMQRKRMENNPEPKLEQTPAGVEEYNKSDVEELESFCKKYGILGVNFGRMNPRAVLQMLKSKMGIYNAESFTPPADTSKKTLLNG